MGKTQFEKFIVSKKGNIFVAVFSCISLIGIGFAGWTYGQTGETTANVTAEADDYFDLNAYFSVPTIKAFDVCSSGLVVDETIVFQGEIEISTTIKIANGLLDAYPDITDGFTVKYKQTNKGSFNYFINTFMGSNTPTVRYAFSQTSTDSYSSCTATIDGSSVTASFALNDSNVKTYDYLTLTFVYSFDFTSQKNVFEANIYNKLGNNPLDLSLTFGVTV